MQLIKAFIFVAACSAANAATIATAPTKDGGEIRLTDTPCKGYPSLLRATITTSNNKLITGCWALLDGLVIVAWDDGDRTSYKPEGFKNARR